MTRSRLKQATMPIQLHSCLSRQVSLFHFCCYCLLQVFCPWSASDTLRCHSSFYVCSIHPPSSLATSVWVFSIVLYLYISIALLASRALDIAITVIILVKRPRSGLPTTVLYKSSYLHYIYMSLPEALPTTAIDTVGVYMPKCYSQLQAKDLPKVPKWRLERDSNPRPSS